MTGFPFLDRFFPDTDSRFVMAWFLMAALLVCQAAFALVFGFFILDADGQSGTGLLFSLALLSADIVCFWLVWRNLHAPMPPALRSIGFVSSRVSMGTTLGLVLLLYLGAGLLAGLYLELVDYDGQKTTIDMIEAASNESAFVKILLFLGVVIIGPVLEEVIFRGYLQSALVARFSPAIGIIGSACIFAAFHFQPEAFVLLALIGAACGLAYHITHSLWPAVLLHIVNNAAFIVNLFYIEG